MAGHGRRFQRLRQIQRLDPDRDYHEIYRTTALYEFPVDVRIGLLLAFWRTFAVPSIAELLAGTGQTTNRTARRADDTGILMYELIDHGLDHPRGRTATRRLNQIHRRFAIGNDDYRYVLGTFVFVGSRWIEAHGWRPLCCHERQAIFNFYAELGRRMNIADIPPTWTGYEAWFDRFEAARFARTDAARELMAATKGLLADLPRPLVPLGSRLVDALVDPSLRAATGLATPSWPVRAGLDTALRIRALMLRHVLPPRRDSSLAGGLRPRTYPDGYDLATVGGVEPGRPHP
ncbi:oxygenase MpaB family protein [Rugosimonospora acidiphila]|uniref:Oxygenase MpaB family protein n=1 Tax=Rugosimonospora acidiphila TaxID=556531 RepID=A0ABP9S6U1_9ACTN